MKTLILTDRGRYNRTRYRAERVLQALQALVDAGPLTDASHEEFAAALSLRDLIRAKQAERDVVERERRQSCASTGRRGV